MMVLLEGAWKWKWGIIAHQDYYSPFGAFNYVLVAWGSTLGGGMSNALPTAVCLFAFFILPTALYASFTRMPIVLACFTTFAIMTQALAPHMLRFPDSDWTYAAIYNRWAYSLFCIALLVTTTFSSKPSKWKDLLDGFIASACAMLSIFIKISYGLLLVVALIGFVLIYRRRLSYYIGAISAAVLLIGIFGIMLNWSFGCLIHDMNMAVHARQDLGLAEFFSSALYLYPEICTVLMLASLCFTTHILFTQVSGWLGLSRPFLLCGCCVFCAVAIVASNSPLGDLRESPVMNICSLILLGYILNHCSTHVQEPSPKRLRLGKRVAYVFLSLACVVVAGVVFLAWSQDAAAFGSSDNTTFSHQILRYSSLKLLTGEAALCGMGWFLVAGSQSKRREISKYFGIILMLLTVVPSMTQNVQGLIKGVAFKASGRSLPKDQVFDSGGLSGVEICEYGGEPCLPTSYVGKVKDGLSLLEQTGSINKIVAVLDFSDPFDVVRGVRPAKGTPTGWQLGFVYSAEQAPPGQQVFEGVEAVLLPKQFGDGNQENLKVLLDHYGTYLESNYVAAAQSQQWVLLKAKRNDISITKATQNPKLLLP
jgi:hypothetical protein